MPVRNRRQMHKSIYIFNKFKKKTLITFTHLYNLSY
jgi:hypothetical protein